MKRKLISKSENNENNDACLEKKSKISLETSILNPTIPNLVDQLSSETISTEISNWTGKNELSCLPILETDRSNPQLTEDLIDFKHEPKVGISEYRNKLLIGFKGVIKLRYSDFQVNEIGLDNNAVHLTTLDYSYATQQENEAAFDPQDIRISKLTSEQMDNEIDNVSFQ